jgi:hypothetical protein
MKPWWGTLPARDQHERTERTKAQPGKPKILAVKEKSREDTGPGTLPGVEKIGEPNTDSGSGGLTTRRADQQKQKPAKTNKPMRARDLEADTASKIRALLERRKVSSKKKSGRSWELELRKSTGSWSGPGKRWPSAGPRRKIFWRRGLHTGAESNNQVKNPRFAQSRGWEISTEKHRSDRNPNYYGDGSLTGEDRTWEQKQPHTKKSPRDAQQDLTRGPKNHQLGLDCQEGNQPKTRWKETKSKSLSTNQIQDTNFWLKLNKYYIRSMKVTAFPYSLDYWN